MFQVRWYLLFCFSKSFCLHSIELLFLSLWIEKVYFAHVKILTILIWRGGEKKHNWSHFVTCSLCRDHCWEMSLFSKPKPFCDILCNLILNKCHHKWNIPREWWYPLLRHFSFHLYLENLPFYVSKIEAAIISMTCVLSSSELGSLNLVPLFWIGPTLDEPVWEDADWCRLESCTSLHVTFEISLLPLARYINILNLVLAGNQFYDWRSRNILSVGGLIENPLYEV